MKVLSVLSACLGGVLLCQARLRLHIPSRKPGGAACAVSMRTRREEASLAAALPAALLKRWRVNEAGRVPILEYHEVGPNPPHAGRATREMHRSVEEFQGDLQRLYVEGYRAVSLSEYLDNKMDLPLGTSPVILTFDDARPTQFQYRRDGSVSPDCAVGILQAFHRTHPDWPLKAMFYVLPQGAFGSEREEAAKKMRALLAMGFELGNHTLSHRYFQRLSDTAIIKEIALGKAATEKAVPGAAIDTLCLPGGQHPRSRHEAILVSGVYKTVRYRNRAILDAWGGPAPSPVSLKFAPFRLPRIQGVNGEDGVAYYLDVLKSHPVQRYVSDGCPNTVTVPARLAKWVNRERLQGQALCTYAE